MTAHVLFLLTFRFSGERDPNNPKFGQEVSKVKPQIVLFKNQIQIFLNNSYLVELINHLSLIEWLFMRAHVLN